MYFVNDPQSPMGQQLSLWVDSMLIIMLFLSGIHAFSKITPRSFSFGSKFYAEFLSFLV